MLHWTLPSFWIWTCCQSCSAFWIIWHFSNAAQRLQGCRLHHVVKLHTPGALITEDIMTLQLQAQQGLAGWVPAAAATCCRWIPKAVSRAGDGGVCQWGKKKPCELKRKRLRGHVCVCVSCICVSSIIASRFRSPASRGDKRKMSVKYYFI